VFIFIGGSYFFANRFLPSASALKATPWTAGAAFLGYFLAQFIAGLILALLGIPPETMALPLIAVSLLGAFGGGALVLHGFVRRHRRRKAEREAQSAVF
jgi:hypothetical protein